MREHDAGKTFHTISRRYVSSRVRRCQWTRSHGPTSVTDRPGHDPCATWPTINAGPVDSSSFSRQGSFEGKGAYDLDGTKPQRSTACGFTYDAGRYP